MASHPPDPAPTPERASSAILTIPNALSFIRIALIPVFVWLIVDPDTTFGGLLLFGAVVSTDWVDGAVARARGQVSELGKVLDPVADRLSIAAGLIALIVRGAFPLWAALLILVRDASVLLVGLVLLAGKGARIEVRYIGKVATFCLMSSIVAVAWGNLGYAFSEGFPVIGWSMYAVGIVDSYAATALYVGDMRRALSNTSRR
jgi:cardiolipin synthase